MKSYIYTSWYLQTYCLSILTNMTTNEVLHLHLLISTNIMSVNLNEYDDKWSLTFTLLDIYKHIVCQSNEYDDKWSLTFTTLISTNILSDEYDDKWSLTFTLLDIYKHIGLSILTNMTTNEVLHLHFLISTYIFCQS